MKRLYLDFFFYDVLPWALVLGAFIAACIWIPQILIGIVVGWLACSYREKLKTIICKTLHKLEECHG